MPKIEDLPKTTRRKYLLINALARLDKPTMKDLQRETGISTTSLQRHIAALRAEFQINVRYIRPAAATLGESGYYEMLDWGVFDREKFCKHYGGMISDESALDARQSTGRNKSS